MSLTSRPLISKADKAMVKLYVEDPKITKTEAWKRTHNTLTDNVSSLHQQAAHTFSQPQVKTELSKYNNLIEDVLGNTVSDWGTSEKTAERSIAVDTAKYIHDKIHGKATQRVESTTTGVTLTIDLTSSLTDEAAQLTGVDAAPIPSVE